jgi:glucose-1-phosphate cytidylyltransferase
MKVVLFCGGLGLRMREYSETIPKPMIEVGYRPIIWHVMRYYAAYGHREFILCLGHRGDYIKRYFLNYDECLSNDFVLSGGGKDVQLFNRDIQDWKITFVDTGLHANVGQRLLAAKPYLEDDDAFMANYSDGLSDVHLPSYLEFFQHSGRVATFVAVKPAQTFHVVSIQESGTVQGIGPVAQSEIWANGGFFVFKREIFDYMRDGEELVEQPFQRLIAAEQLIAYRHRGFFACLDTYKEKQLLDDLYARDQMPWAVWRDKTHGAAVAQSG